MNYAHLFVVTVCVFTLVFVSACSSSADNQPEKLLISAAVSLKDSLEEIQMLYEQQFPHVKLSFNFGASGMLRQQIEQGAAADVFLSADEANMKQLVEKQFIKEEKLTVFIKNELVAIIHKNSNLQLSIVSDLLQESIKYVALGHPQTVPAGAYAREALAYFGMWDSLQPNMVFGNNVRQVLTYIETGNAVIGFVYKTDALISNDVSIAFTFDDASHRPIQYFAGIVSNNKQREQTAAKSFYTFLQGSEAQEVFHKYGFASTR